MNEAAAGPQSSDTELWPRALTGDHDAFGELFDRYAFGVANGLLRNATRPPRRHAALLAGVRGVMLTGLSGNVAVRTSTGSVTATGLTGADDQFRVGTGRIDAVANTGPVTVEVPSTATYQVSASTGLGAANVSVPPAANSDHVITARTGTGPVAASG